MHAASKYMDKLCMHAASEDMDELCKHAASDYLDELCMHASLSGTPDWVIAAAAVLCSMPSTAGYAPARPSAFVFGSSMLQLLI